MEPGNDALLMMTMPMRFNGLVVETTNRCNARCGMCYQSAGPKGSSLLGAAKLDVSALRRCIREAASIPTLTPRFHLAGGEAFMHLDECYELFAEARAAGYLDITGTTNAFWARTPEHALDVAGRLRGSGVTSIEISWDYWHAPYIRPEAVANCLVACAAVDIETNLRILTTRSHDLAEALDLLPSNVLGAAHRITSGPVFATGRAATQIAAEDIHASSRGALGSCHAVLNLTVNSFGNVFPCCAGFDQTKNYLFGNIHSESIVDVAERLNRDPIARLLVFKGPSALLPLLQRSGVELTQEFKNMCQLCWTIFSSEEAVAAIRRRIDQSAERVLKQVTASDLRELGEAT